MSAPNGEGPTVAAATPLEQSTADATIVADARRDDKDDNTLIAVAAIAGFQARKLANGHWLVSRWNLSREMSDADEVRAFLASAGVRV